jgi:hypothetical protein
MKHEKYQLSNNSKYLSTIKSFKKYGLSSTNIFQSKILGRYLLSKIQNRLKRYFFNVLPKY